MNAYVRPGPGENEIVREAKRVLRKLMMDAAVLRPMDGGYALLRTTKPAARPILRLGLAMVEAFRRRDWLISAPDSKNDGDGDLILSDAGLGWIRRTMAGSDPFAEQHGLRAAKRIEIEGEKRLVTINEGEAPLGWLYRRKLIGAAQFEAGEKLRVDFTLAQLTPRMAVDLAAPVVAGRRGAKELTLPETVLAAKQRYERAVMAVGPGLSDILVDVCCHLVGLETAERQKNWPQRSAKIVLAIALDRLAAHYGLNPVVGARSAIRAWAAPEADEPG